MQAVAGKKVEGVLLKDLARSMGTFLSFRAGGKKGRKVTGVPEDGDQVVQEF